LLPGPSVGLLGPEIVDCDLQIPAVEAIAASIGHDVAGSEPFVGLI